MKQFDKKSLIFLLVLVAGYSSHAQHRFFDDVKESEIKSGNHKRTIIPQQYRTVAVSTAKLKTFLWSLPSEKNIVDRKLAAVIELPMPDGNWERFRVWESSIQEPGLEIKFPEIKTFLGQGIDDPYATVRFDYTGFGFHAQVLSVHGNVYIDPFARGDVNNYISYYARENKKEDPWVCQVKENAGSKGPGGTNVVPVGPCRGTQLNTYRLAVACTGEYAVAVGGTTPALLHSAIVTTVNRVVGVYEQELAVRMVLVANNNVIEFLNAGTDPFNGNNDAGTLINESENVISATIGNTNFDIGHTFSTGGGGLAGLGVVCVNGQKASGITGSPNPVGDDYDIDYVAHEIGHQFGGDHTFNSSASNCGGGNRNGPTAYEVGSGTTIMAYAGICGNDDIQPHSDPTFHSVSFDEISVYLQNGATCGVMTATGNNLPQITAMSNNSVSIPVNTPFTLTATATDADGDALTYCWEDWNLGPTTTWNGGTANTTSPLFKQRVPKTTGSRTFPDQARIAANYLPAVPPAVMGGLRGETLPTSARTMKFRLTVRDNHAGGGGIVTGGNGCQTGYTGVYSVTTVGTSPFAVTVPNGGESYAGGSTQTITWNVVGTDAAPINVATVMISLSTDGGLTFPTIISASTANDGSEAVTIPAVTSTTARIKVEAIGNIFFDISNANFTITPPPAGYAFTQPSALSVGCGAGTSAGTNLNTSSFGGFVTPIILSAAGNPAGTTVSFSPNPVTPGNGTNILVNNINTLSPGTYNITINGVAGTTTQSTSLSFTILPGAPPSISSQPVATSVCSGDNAVFNVVSPDAGVTYQWQVNTGTGGFSDIPGATAATYSFITSQANSGNQYHVIISYQCGSVTSDDVSLTVNTAANITTQPASFTACENDSHMFSVVASGTGISYQWQVSVASGPFTDIAGETNATLNLAAITNGMNGNQYQVVISSTGSACPAPGVSNTVTLTVNPLPVLTAAADATSVCTGSAVNLTATGANSYTWAPGTGLNSANVTVYPEVTVGAPGVPNSIVYTVTGTSLGCVSTASVTVTANPLPIVTLSTDPVSASTTLLPFQTVLLRATVAPAGSFFYTWTRDGVVVPNNTDSLRVGVTDDGIYHVTVADITGTCGSTSNDIAIMDSLNGRFYIYPNPNQGQFVIKFRNPNQVGNVTCFDSKGARVYAQINITDRAPYQVIDVNLGGASSGIYILTIYDKAGIRLATERVIVRR
ncbi:MAG: reprolysin-like metallopeptidase [Ferruginibacter sp.]